MAIESEKDPDVKRYSFFVHLLNILRIQINVLHLHSISNILYMQTCLHETIPQCQFVLLVLTRLVD